MSISSLQERLREVERERDEAVGILERELKRTEALEARLQISQRSCFSLLSQRDVAWVVARRLRALWMSAPVEVGDELWPGLIELEEKHPWLLGEEEQ